MGLDGNAPEIAAGIEAAVRDGMHVINLSLGEPEIEPSRDLVVAAVEGATAPASWSHCRRQRLRRVRPRLGRIAGHGASAITVGAVDGAGADLADFSAAGPTPVSLRLKPEVTAPGVDILSSVPTAWAAGRPSTARAWPPPTSPALLRSCASATRSGRRRR